MLRRIINTWLNDSHWCKQLKRRCLVACYRSFIKSYEQLNDWEVVRFERNPWNGSVQLFISRNSVHIFVQNDIAGAFSKDKRFSLLDWISQHNGQFTHERAVISRSWSRSVNLKSESLFSCLELIAVPFISGVFFGTLHKSPIFFASGGFVDTWRVVSRKLIQKRKTC